MNEADAKKVLLIRAIEGSDAEGKFLSAEDRGFAGRAAAELVRWQAASRGENASAPAFIAKRAELLSARLAERFPKAMRSFEAMRWRAWVGVLLPLLALISGAVAEHLGDLQRVNILAFPLLGLLLWNAIVYLLLLVSALPTGSKHPGRQPGWLQRQLSGLHNTFARRSAGPLAGMLAHFVVDWTQRSSPLLIARAARVLHLSAALLAAGAIAGLYVRGLVFEYRAGWDSTFLDASAVHSILAFFLQPAAQLVGLPFPGVDEIATLRWSAGRGENAARWIHMYAVAALLVIVVPRLLLAFIAGRRERRCVANFPLTLDEPYFRRVLSVWRESPARIRIAPYAYTPAETARASLQRVAAQLFGDSAQLRFDQTVDYGQEDSQGISLSANSSAPDAVIALFNLATTPETENHGVFLDGLKALAQGSLLVLVDEGPLRRRLDAQAGSQARLAERRQAWSGLAGTRGLNAVFADLEAPDLAGAERDLELQLSRGTSGN